MKIIFLTLSITSSNFFSVPIESISAVKRAALETHFLGIQRAELFHSINPKVIKNYNLQGPMMSAV